MSVVVIEENTALQAWREGVTALFASGGSCNNIITTVLDPCHIDSSWLVDHSPDTVSEKGNDIRDVANTIFPEKLLRSATSRDHLYEMYLKRHDRVRHWKGHHHGWGTYFERLVRFPPDGVNQLERVIGKLISWPTRNTTGLVFHLSSPIDAPRTRGGPCWHFGEILWNADGILDLVVVYRNHDFYNKVLGNFIGLGRLLKFICDETGKTPGRLVCHSVHAYHEGTLQNLRELVG